LLTANFLGPSAAHLVPIWNGQPILDQEGVGYIVGTTATVIFWGMTSIVKKYVDVASLTRGADK
jgi:hypothetical protein